MTASEIRTVKNMRPSELIQSLKLSKRLKLICPACDESIPLSRATLFTDDDLSEGAHDFLQRKKDEIVELKSELLELRKKKLDRVLKGTKSSGLGKILEKFLPILPGFPFKAEESIPLLDPIDYISFVGLLKNRIDFVSFMDLKSGNGRLQPSQKSIKAAIEQGKVSVDFIERAKT